MKTITAQVPSTSLHLKLTCAVDVVRPKYSFSFCTAKDLVIFESFDQFVKLTLGNSSKFANNPVSGLCTRQYL